MIKATLAETSFAEGQKMFQITFRFLSETSLHFLHSRSLFQDDVHLFY